MRHVGCTRILRVHSDLWFSPRPWRAEGRRFDLAPDRHSGPVRHVRGYLRWVGVAKTGSHGVHGNPGEEQRGGVRSRPDSLKEGP